MLISANSAAQDTEIRERCHSIILALNEIGYLLQGDIDAETLVDKKGSAPQ